ncbi:glycerate kinase [Viridibacterium curvum]|uniref:Glycerate kinase n=1 Tax=Viridibacterium curvum TaxID=1101404 RepID=A0ABP9QQD4_9RHOO
MSFHPQTLLHDMAMRAIDAVAPARCLPPFLPPPPRGRTVVVGAGKAAAEMAAVVEQHWSGPLTGIVVTRYGHSLPCERIEVIEAAHPVPDEAGMAAAARILQAVQGLGPDDMVLCLISGGGSALLGLPAEGITLADKQAINRALLRSGASIAELNCVRKHLSAIKGGRLGVACAPARVVTLVLSDVPGDDPSVVASGPTLPDATTCAEALSILQRYAIDIPAAARALLESGLGETPKPDDPRFVGHACQVVATAQDALEAAAAVALQAGVTPLILGNAIEGEAREVARMHAGMARQVRRHGQPLAPPCVLISGGETSVTVRGRGRGGRNAEFLLSLVCALEAEPGVYALAIDTDGIDGSEDNAGCRMAPDTLARSRAQGLSARALLDDNDAYRFFATLDDLIVTGPTRTNVNDLRLLLIV